MRFGLVGGDRIGSSRSWPRNERRVERTAFVLCSSVAVGVSSSLLVGGVQDCCNFEGDAFNLVSFDGRGEGISDITESLSRFRFRADSGGATSSDGALL